MVALPCVPRNPSSIFFLYCWPGPRGLHSFPTRRSSDLAGRSDRRSGRTHHGLHAPSLESGPPRLSPSDRKSTRLNSSHVEISYAVFCLKKKTTDMQEAEQESATIRAQ